MKMKHYILIFEGMWPAKYYNEILYTTEEEEAETLWALTGTDPPDFQFCRTPRTGQCRE